MKLDWRLVKLLRPYRAKSLLSLMAGLIAATLVTLQASYLSQSVSRIFLERGTFTDVKKSLTYLLGIILIRGALVFIHERMIRQVATNFKRDLRIHLYNRLISLGPTFLKTGDKEGVRSGALVNLVLEGIENLEVYLSQYLPQIVLSMLVPASILFVVWRADLLSGLILLITAPLIPFFMVLIGDRAENLTKRQWSLLSRMNAHFLDVLQGLFTLRIFGRSHAQAEVIRQVGDRYRQTTMRVLKIAFLSSLTLEWLATLSIAVIAVEIGLRLLYGRLVYEQAFLILLLAPEFYAPLRALAAKFHAGMAGIASSEHIFEIMDTPGSASSGSPPPKIERKDLPSNPGTLPLFNLKDSTPNPLSITFKDVSYSPPHRQSYLEKISFDLPSGQLLVVTGESGVGKSSLIDLLLRFQEPTQGQIKINGIPLKDLRREMWLGSIAWVPQKPYILNASILDNIRLGKPDATLSEVISAAIQAQAHDFICRLPHGYETIVGEHGNRLSGGEAQRIALARAFLKNAPLLLLDEATAHLDPFTATMIYRSILARKGRQTIVLITHDLRMLQGADYILILKDGKLITFRKFTEVIDWHDEPESLEEATSIDTLSRDPRSTLPAFNAVLSKSSERQNIPSPSLDEKKTGGTISYLGYLIDYIQPFLSPVILSLALGWATIASGIGLLAVSAYLISVAALHTSIAVLQVSIVAVRTFGLLRGIFRYLERYLSHDTSFKILAKQRVRFFRYLEPLVPGQLTYYSSGDLLSRLHNDLLKLQDFYTRSLSPPVIWFLILLTIGVYLKLYSQLLAIFVIGLHLLTGVCLPIVTRVLERKVRRQQPHLRSMLSSLLIDGIQGMPDLLVYGAITEQVRKVQRACDFLASNEKRFSLTRSLDKMVNLLATNLAGWFVVVAVIASMNDNRNTGLYLAALILATAASFEATIPLSRAGDILVESLTVASRLNEIEKTPTPIELLPKYHPMPPGTTLEVRDLRFSYPTVEQNNRASQLDSKVSRRERHTIIEDFRSFTLKDITFSLPPGKRLALIGPTGAGKSTLFNLLLRFWEYDQGTILLGGDNIRLLEPDSVRTSFSLVTQHAHLFNATIADNLRIAKPEADLEELIHVAKLAQIHDFIVSLPQGYETWVGEHGIRLSAGERQRIAIARALLKDAPILLLDEPVAHLNVDLAQSVLRNIYAHNSQRAIITITHRLLEMEAMDEILLMFSGEIIARGRHSDLLAEPLYRLMWFWENPRAAHSSG